MSKRCLVTGCAGFMGSHLCERLLKDGYEVVGVDCFTDYYSREIKEKNMEGFKSHRWFQFIPNDLNNMDLSELLDEVDFVFHEAAQAGVRASWGTGFDAYIRCNITATQKLLEAAKGKAVKKFVYASSSSVYGDSPLPMKEGNVPRPVSPYGVTKLAAENLCYLYWKNYGVPTVSLRYFTVYGPRQRPDMGIYLFIKGILLNEQIKIFGDVNMTRDFTFIKDVIDANLSCLDERVPPGLILNIGGGSRITIGQLIEYIKRLTNRESQIVKVGFQRGDVLDTQADISLAREKINYFPKADIEHGLKQQIDYMRKSLNIE